MIERVSLLEAEYVAHGLARELMDYGEPVADFHARYPGRLESCLEQPFMHLQGRYVYWRLNHRAAVLFYLLIKNHPFHNGNKRMAVTITMTFVYKNGYWLDFSPDALYSVAKMVSESDPGEKQEIVKMLKASFGDRLTALDSETLTHVRRVNRSMRSHQE
ncbi:type II toxin-antitoxin system death-on-curing family toxin [Streptomyces sp. P11-1]|uniref:type II toxin-antitoxin system death-on-curing family toxin n=1 Tax=Streptomyces sp. P11-1 TaxID=3423221 RepID=UPI003D2ED8D3